MALERLHKVMAEAGVASRRHAEEMIAAGRVTVNGEVIREMGVKVDPERDRIEVDGKPLTPEAKVYLALNKPNGVVTTVDDPEERQTVLDLLPDNLGRVYPVGRLDMESQGLLLLTNDGDLAYRLTHPSFEHEKEYKIRVAGHPSEQLLADLGRGIELEDGPTLPAEISILQKKRDATWLRVVLREGRKRQLRRMFDAIEHPVRDLIRLRVGPIQLGDLPPGQWRHLSAKEVQALRRMAAGQDFDIVRPPASRDRNAARAAGAAGVAAGAAAVSRAGGRPPRRNEGPARPDDRSAPPGRGRRIDDAPSRSADRPSRPGDRPAPGGRSRRPDETSPRPGRPGPERRPHPDDDDDWWMRDERPSRRASGGSRPPGGGGPRPAAGNRPASSGGRPAAGGSRRPTAGGGARPSSGSGRPSSSGGGRPASAGGGRPSGGGSGRAAGGGGRPSSSSSRAAGGGGRPSSSSGRAAGGGGRPPSSSGRSASTGRPASAGSRPPSRGGSRPSSGSGGRPPTSRPPSRSGSKRGGPKR